MNSSCLYSFSEIYDMLPADGWLSRVEAELLHDEVQKTTGNILEIGCYQGRSTVLFAKTCPHRTVYCVDPYFDGFHSELMGDEIHSKFWANLKSRRIENVRLFKEPIENWMPRDCGFVYCDGDHTYQGTRIQIIKAAFCRPKTICIHDVNDSGGGRDVKRAALDILGPWRERVERVAVWDLK